MSKVFIIAEAGVNHNKDLKLAKRLIDTAADAECDAVKFQTFKAEKLVTRNAAKAEYQISNTGSIDSQYKMLKDLELGYKDFIILKEYCELRKIMFLSTPFDETSADLLEDLDVPKYKIPSGEITNKPFIKHIAKKHKEIILSTGMSGLGEVEEAVGWIYEENNQNVKLLHCTSNYPASYKNVNLKAMLTMKNAFGLEVGYSDHTEGIEVPLAAVALGACIIEKHFTLDRSLPGPDHKASLEPQELRKMVTMIRNVEVSMGNGIKKPAAEELSTATIARKSIVANTDIYKGMMITSDMLAVKRPGTGIKPKYLELVVGRIAARDIMQDEVITIDDLANKINK